MTLSYEAIVALAQAIAKRKAIPEARQESFPAFLAADDLVGVLACFPFELVLAFRCGRMWRLEMPRE